MVFGNVRLYCGNSGKIGNYNSQEVGLAKAMKKLGYDCYIFIPDKNLKTPQETVIEDEVTLVSVPAKVVGGHSKFDWSILKKYKVDVVQIASGNQLSTPSIFRYCDKNNIKSYHYIGVLKSDTTNKYKKIVMDILFKRNISSMLTHRVFAKNTIVQKELAELGVKNVTLAPVGLDTSIIPQITADKCDLRDELGISQSHKLVLFVGRMDEYKRPLELIKLAKMLPEEYKFIAVGSGLMNDKFEQTVKLENLSNRITRIKQISKSEIHKYYMAADYFVNFNDKEIFGMSILEAMYQGCTVIANHAPGPDDIIENGVSGFLTDDTEQMAELISNNSLVSSESAKLRVTDKFSWDSTANKIDRWIKTV